MKSTITLTNFQPGSNTLPIPQQQVLDYTAWLLATGLCSKDGIESDSEAEKMFSDVQLDVARYGVAPKYVSQRELNSLANNFSYDTKAFTTDRFPDIFENILQNSLGRDLNSRLAFYDVLVYDILEKWYADDSFMPNDIIHATCTGYLSPSPIQKLLSTKDKRDITVTHSYQMGCYGAIPPLRMAVGFLTSHLALEPSKTQIDVLHTEYSSLHFQATNSSPDQIVSMTLFGDGFIKYSVCLDDTNKPTKHGLKVLTTYDLIIPSSLNEMSLIPGPYNFEMWLSKNVPLKIKEEIYGFVCAICKQIGLNFDKIKDEMIFALHPGGPKIIDHIQERLGLRDDQMRFSRKILFEHGNMVSATLPYIWKEIVEDKKVLPGTKVMSIAFGPGITVAGFILEKV